MLVGEGKIIISARLLQHLSIQSIKVETRMLLARQVSASPCDKCQSSVKNRWRASACRKKKMRALNFRAMVFFLKKKSLALLEPSRIFLSSRDARLFLLSSLPCLAALCPHLPSQHRWHWPPQFFKKGRCRCPMVPPSPSPN